jgi:hypothetical protein
VGLTSLQTSAGASLSTANTWTALQNFSSGLTVSGGTISFPANSIPASCISGLSSSGSLGTQVSLNLSNTYNYLVGSSGVKLPLDCPWVSLYNRDNETITLFRCSEFTSLDTTTVWMVQMNIIFINGTYPNPDNIYFLITNEQQGTKVFDHYYYVPFNFYEYHQVNTFILSCKSSTTLRFRASCYNQPFKGYTKILQSINLQFTRIA